jgi:hypothetical protein
MQIKTKYIHWEDAIANCTAEHITPLLYSLIINETELALCYSFHKTIIFGVFPVLGGVCFVGKMEKKSY